VNALAETGFREPAVWRLDGDAVEAALGAADFERAEALATEFEAKAARSKIPWSLAVSARCRALLLAADGEPERAEAQLERALVDHDRCPMPFELARTLLAQGETLRRFKKKRAAREAIEGAIAIFDELGAKLWSAKARREVARISGRTRAGGLTETERRVAELVAAGRSNKEIASELFVTVRTVETHLTKVYAKLAVHSRTELVSRLFA
jgi:DNA-binding CsgD family transcriptional regulator